MLLYLEKDLDKAYRLDCKARTREQFRSLYEDLISLHLEKAEYENIIVDDIPEWVLNSINTMLETTLTLEK